MGVTTHPKKLRWQGHAPAGLRAALRLPPARNALICQPVPLVLNPETMTTAESPTASGALPLTSWTIVHKIGIDTAGGRRALGRLYSDYRQPMCTFLRTSGFSPEDAEDLVQGFFERSMTNGFFRRARPERGRFRTFLLTSLRNFANDETNRRHSLKRGGRHGVVPSSRIDDLAERPMEGRSATPDPEVEFDRQWTLTLLHRSLNRLQASFLSETGSHRFTHLRAHLECVGESPSYAETAERLGVNESHARVMVHRLRQRFRMVLQEEVAQTLLDPTPETIREELESLLSAFQRGT